MTDVVAPTRFRLLEAYRSRRHSWRLTLGAVFLAEALMLIVVGRHQWYFFDEWRLVVERVAPHPQGARALFEQLFKPDGEHVIALPLAVFIVLTRWVGIDNYWPFIVANVVIRLATLWLADDIIRRLSARRSARLFVVTLIAFFGAGHESLFGQSLIFAGMTLVFCLLAIREMLKPAGNEWIRGGIAAAFLVGAIFSSSYGFPVVVGVSLYFVLTSRRIAAALSLIVPPVAFLVVRALAGGAYAQQQPVALDRVPLYIDYVQFGLGRVGEGITGLDGLGFASFVALVAGCVWLSRGKPTAWFGLAMLLSVVAFFGQASLSRSIFGAEQAGASRYVFFCAVLGLMALGAAWGQRRVDPRQAVVVALVVLISLSNSVGELIAGGTDYTDRMQLAKNRLTVGFAALARGSGQFVPDPDGAPDLFLDRLYTVLDWSGSDELIEIGDRCFQGRLDELAAAGVDVELLDIRTQTALVLLLNEHAVGALTATPQATIGELIAAAADGGITNSVIQQFQPSFQDALDTAVDLPQSPQPVDGAAAGSPVPQPAVAPSLELCA